MKSSELRIGNYLYDDGGNICKVARIETSEYTLWNSGESFSIIALIVGSVDDYIYHTQDSRWRPIPLTEEWLLEFGFYFDFGVYWSESRVIKIKDTYFSEKDISMTIHERLKATSKVTLMEELIRKPSNKSTKMIEYLGKRWSIL